MAMFFSRKKLKIKASATKKEGFSGWLKCSECSELVHTDELKRNFNVCPKCSFHFRLSSEERILQLCDPDSFQEYFGELTSVDKLKFVDTEKYYKRLEQAQAKSQLKEAIIVGTATINSLPFALAVMDFNFMGGSMGSVVGEKLTRLIEKAISDRLPLVVVSTSGGARMQESTLSLMQMAKTAAALARLDEARLPFISILTNPTTGGVTASFAALGDIIIAEPKALICFAGPRVIEQILGKPLPPGAQQAEFLLQHGMIDLICPRAKLKNTIKDILTFLPVQKQSSQYKVKGKEWTSRIS